MCGNGIRCMARFLADLEGKKTAEYKIHTLAGTIIPVVSSAALLLTQVLAVGYEENGLTLHAVPLAPRPITEPNILFHRRLLFPQLQKERYNARAHRSAAGSKVGRD